MSKIESADIGGKELQNVKAQTNGIIRSEVRLTRPKAVRSYTESDNVSDQLCELWENQQHIFLDIFSKIIPFGDSCKKDRAIEIVKEEVHNNTLRRKMVRIIELVPEKKSIWLAQKAANCWDADKIMRAFAKIELAPVTIGKRHAVKHLKSLYNYL